MRTDGSPEKVVQEVRRKTRRRLSAEETIRIVLEGLRGEERSAKLCRKAGLAPNLSDRWSKGFLEAGKKRLVGETSREAEALRGHRSAHGADPPAAARGRDRPRKPAAPRTRDGLRLGRRPVRLTAADKGDSSRWVEDSDLSVWQTLRERQVACATFDTWSRRSATAEIDGLAPQPSAARRHWNRMPPRARQRVVKAALAAPERIPRERAGACPDREGPVLSESRVSRLLNGDDLIPSPACVGVSAGKGFQRPPPRPAPSAGRPLSRLATSWAGAGPTCPRSLTTTHATAWPGRGAQLGDR